MTYDPSCYWSQQHSTGSGRFNTAGYRALGEGFNRASYTRRRFPALNSLLGKVAGSANVLFEAGVGTGVYADIWRQLGVSRWVGVDISETAIERLRRAYPDQEFFVADIASTNWTSHLSAVRSRQFDLVTAIDVLYHLIDDQKFHRAIRSLGSIVAPEGVFIVSDVFVEYPKRIAPHVKRRPIGQYQKALRALDFKLCGREPVFAILGDPVIGNRGHLSDAILYQTWRVIQKVVRSIPDNYKDDIGAGIVSVLSPVDRVLCEHGVTEGVNLELAAFRRTR